MSFPVGTEVAVNYCASGYFYAGKVTKVFPAMTPLYRVDYADTHEWVADTSRIRCADELGVVTLGALVHCDFVARGEFVLGRIGDIRQICVPVHAVEYSLGDYEEAVEPWRMFATATLDNQITVGTRVSVNYIHAGRFHPGTVIKVVEPNVKLIRVDFSDESSQWIGDWSRLRDQIGETIEVLHNGETWVRGTIGASTCLQEPTYVVRYDLGDVEEAVEAWRIVLPSSIAATSASVEATSALLSALKAAHVSTPVASHVAATALVTPTSGSRVMALAVGDRVLAQWQHSTWYRGIVSQVVVPGARVFMVKFDDGVVEEIADVSRLRNGSLVVGGRIEALWCGRSWWPCTIESVRTLAAPAFNVQFEDGDREDCITRERISPVM